MEDQALSLDPALYDLGFPERGELPARVSWFFWFFLFWSLFETEWLFVMSLI